ncbi:MAG: Cof-type HAD-IIB family hydrolase [Clostridium sp.]|uniref:Cof-type HAD-IIB family hydrolase n=1 Tax=Clostridium sp. TaxID=1506 RepID=UPI003F2F2894
MKILASDMDGTLVIEDKINEKDVQAINELKKKGHKFIVSTGRTLSGMGNIFEKHKLPYDYMVLCNGALILDENNKIIYKNVIENKKIKSIIETFRDKENLMMYMDDGENFYIVQTENIIKNEIYFFEGIDYIKITPDEALKLEQDFIMGSIFACDKDISKAINAKEILNEILHEGESFRNEYFVDIVPSGCSKGKGLEKVLEIENKGIESLYTIGDSYNDISMFQITENSYTFNRVENEVKKHAKNNVDYIYELIEKMLED